MTSHWGPAHDGDGLPSQLCKHHATSALNSCLHPSHVPLLTYPTHPAGVCVRTPNSRLCVSPPLAGRMSVPGEPQPQQLPWPGVCAGAEQQPDARKPQQLRLAHQGGVQAWVVLRRVWGHTLVLGTCADSHLPQLWRLHVLVSAHVCVRRLTRGRLCPVLQLTAASAPLSVR